MGLGKPGRLRVDQPTITVELGPAPDAYTHYSPVMIAALSKDCQIGGSTSCSQKRAWLPGPALLGAPLRVARPAGLSDKSMVFG